MHPNIQQINSYVKHLEEHFTQVVKSIEKLELSISEPTFDKETELQTAQSQARTDSSIIVVLLQELSVMLSNNDLKAGAQYEYIITLLEETSDAEALKGVGKKIKDLDFVNALKILNRYVHIK